MNELSTETRAQVRDTSMEDSMRFFIEQLVTAASTPAGAATLKAIGQAVSYIGMVAENNYNGGPGWALRQEARNV